MLTAVRNGDAKKLVELMGQDPGFDVNEGLDEHGQTLLNFTCVDDRRSAVILLLLAHPDIDVNVKDKPGRTPFYCACGGRLFCVREMLNDSRVKMNEPNKFGETPLYVAARNGHLGVIKWWIASGRDTDLGEPGDVDKTDVIGVAKKKGKTDGVALLERFKSDATQTRHAVRMEVGWYDDLAAEMFALVVIVSDGLLQIKDTTTTTPAARFFNFTKRLPLELQMVLCCRLVGSDKEVIPGKDSEVAFKELARLLL